MTMKLEFGDINNPTGNAIIYWRIKKKSKIFKNAKILASNFVISALQMKDETLVVNFPPVLVDSYEDLLGIAESNNIDIIKGEDVDLPDDIEDFNDFYKGQIEQHNDLIQDYLVAYKEKKNPAESEKTVPHLINLASETMDSVRKLVRIRGSHDVIRIKLKLLEDLHDDLNEKMAGYDLKNIIHLIEKPGTEVDRLVDLYKRKFYAVFLENYEQANRLKAEIHRIERKLIF
ncbi:MAG: hypothetical protein JXQ30_13490 [Spirochaetes bacterium]|nr:hypothetical protein [Spirochaetota bacterium]